VGEIVTVMFDLFGFSGLLCGFLLVMELIYENTRR